MNPTLYSHPDKSLATHLREVMEAARIIAVRHQLSNEVLSQLELLVQLHDFGKGTTFFQEYITYRPTPHHWPGRQEEKTHTPLGMMASAVLKASEKRNNAWLLRIGTSILGHHTRLPTCKDIDSKLIDGMTLLLKQLEHLYLEKLEFITGLRLPKNNFLPNEDTIYKVADTYEDVFNWLEKRPIGGAVRLRLETQLLFSVLLEADKAFLALTDKAQALYKARRITHVPLSVVDDYLKAKGTPDSPVNELRAKARADALDQLLRNEGRSLFTLTLPTGLGKTLTAASLALKLRQAQPRQVILVLPFLSIVDQTAKVYAEVLGQPSTDILMQSHSLSVRDYQDLDGGDAEFFLDTWQSDFIVTTFDQVLLALFSSRTKYQMRFHHLMDAILIFDEVQALPSQLWDITQKALSSLTAYFGTFIIAMSATQPGFISNATELVPEVSTVFKNFGRYQLILRHQQNLPINKFANSLVERCAELQQKRVLITLNTRRSARRIYDELAKTWNDPTCPIYFLSADMTPKDRLNVIDRIKDCPNQPCLVISTQVVEAGVDMDMDLVLRDFAPLDSLIQIAGRCNRNDLKSRCDVEVYTLTNEKGKRYCDLVYRTGNSPDISLQETWRVLEGHKTICEEEVFELAQRYFAALRHHKDLGQIHTRDWAYFREHLNVSKLLRGDQDRQYQFVVAERDEQQTGGPPLQEAVEHALKIEDRWEKRRSLRSLAPRLARVTINVWTQPRFKPEDIAYLVGPFWFVYEGFYDLVTGLQLPVGHVDDTSFL